MRLLLTSQVLLLTLGVWVRESGQLLLLVSRSHLLLHRLNVPLIVLWSRPMGSWSILCLLTVPVLARPLLIVPRLVDVGHTPGLLVHGLPALIHCRGREDGRVPPSILVSLTSELLVLPSSWLPLLLQRLLLVLSLLLVVVLWRLRG